VGIHNASSSDIAIFMLKKDVKLQLTNCNASVAGINIAIHLDPVGWIRLK